MADAVVAVAVAAVVVTIVITTKVEVVAVVVVIKVHAVVDEVEGNREVAASFVKDGKPV